MSGYLSKNSLISLNLTRTLNSWLAISVLIALTAQVVWPSPHHNACPLQYLGYVPCLISKSWPWSPLPSLLWLPIWDSNLFHLVHSPYRQPFQRLSGLDAASKLSDPIMIGLWARNANNGFDHAALRSANAIQRIPILLDPQCHSFLGYFPPFVLLPTPAHPLPPGHNPVGHSGPLGYWLHL